MILEVSAYPGREGRNRASQTATARACNRASSPGAERKAKSLLERGTGTALKGLLPGPPF